MTARRVAVEALVRVERDGAYANLVLPRLLSRSTLPPRDRAFATQLVYGTIRHRRACDWFIDRFAHGDLDPTVRAALRLGTYQLRVLGTPAHAAVSATVDTVPRRARGLVNAVLRKVAEAEDAWPSEAVRLSYPDWVLERLSRDLGSESALAALVSMNGAARVVERADGYVQDTASQWVAASVAARPDERVLDLCAAPGGKATALAGTDAVVVAADVRPARAGLVAANASRLGIAPDHLQVVVTDGRRAPFGDDAFDRVLVDAPCSGLGSLRRRPDARWRLDDGAPERLAVLQASLLAEGARLVRPGGILVYSVCTLTRAETTDVAEAFVAPGGPGEGWEPLSPPAEPWQPWGSGALLLPQTAGTDGMAWFGWRKPGSDPVPYEPSGPSLVALVAEAELEAEADLDNPEGEPAPAETGDQ